MIDKLPLKRYQERPGYRLADVAEVGLPVYSLNVQALTLAHKRLPAVEEFLLRSLALGLRSVDQISLFLGLSYSVLKPAFASLAQTENIALTAREGLQSWSLTHKGQTTLQSSEVIAPEARTFQVYFDAILRKPRLYGSQVCLRHRQLVEEGRIEIEVSGPRRPRLAELTTAEIERLLNTVPRPAEQRRDVLAIQSLDNIRKGFIPADALMFIGADERDIQLGFVIDGVLSKEHEMQFAGTDSFRRVAERLLSGADRHLELSAIRDAVKMPPGVASEASKAGLSTAKAEAQVAEQTEALKRATSDEDVTLIRERLREAQGQLERAQNEARQLPVRYLGVLEHAPLLQEAIENAKDRVLIVSPWIRAKVVNRTFLERLENALLRGVTVYIGFGIKEDERTADLQNNDREAVGYLRRLAEKYRKFHLVRLGNTHAKILVQDSCVAVVTSFNWLSFRGDPNRTFRDEQGVLIQQPDLVDKKFNELVGRFDKS